MKEDGNLEPVIVRLEDIANEATKIFTRHPEFENNQEILNVADLKEIVPDGTDQKSLAEYRLRQMFMESYMHLYGILVLNLENQITFAIDSLQDAFKKTKIPKDYIRNLRETAAEIRVQLEASEINNG